MRTNNNGPTNEVSKEKLINLWFEKRKKAISIIKNDGLWPVSVQANISVERTETYYQESSKCTVSHGFEEDEPSFFDRSMAAGTVTQGDYFGIDEIESIVNSCPKRKSCGSDGVFYEEFSEPSCSSSFIVVFVSTVMSVVCVSLPSLNVALAHFARPNCMQISSLKVLIVLSSPSC